MLYCLPDRLKNIGHNLIIVSKPRDLAPTRDGAVPLEFHRIVGIIKLVEDRPTMRLWFGDD